MKTKTTNGKKAAAHDVEPEAPKAKEEKKDEKPEQRYELGSTATVKRGFLLLLTEWARKHKTFTVAQAVDEFNGRQVNSRKVDASRCARYFAYCRNHGIFKLVKNGGTK